MEGEPACTAQLSGNTGCGGLGPARGSQRRPQPNREASTNGADGLIRKPSDNAEETPGAQRKAGQGGWLWRKLARHRFPVCDRDVLPQPGQFQSSLDVAQLVPPQEDCPSCPGWSETLLWAPPAQHLFLLGYTWTVAITVLLFCLVLFCFRQSLLLCYQAGLELQILLQRFPE